MPFKSEKQKRYLAWKHPKIHEEWSKKYGKEIVPKTTAHKGVKIRQTKRPLQMYDFLKPADKKKFHKIVNVDVGLGKKKKGDKKYGIKFKGRKKNI